MCLGRSANNTGMDHYLKVSVVMCTFNGARFVGTQLESILSQSHLPDEIVVCDDASTDGTAEIIEGFRERQPSRLRFFRNPVNLGINRNFEAAIQAATGDIIFLSDQDDFWFENKIAAMTLPFYQSDQVGLVYSDAELADETLRPLGQTLFARRKNMRLDAKRPAYRLLQGIGFQGCMMAFRSALKRVIPPIPPLWGHDHWIALLAYASANVRPLAQPLIYYRRHGGNFGIDPDLDHAWLFLRLNQWKRIAEGVSVTALPADEELRCKSVVERLQEIKETMPSSNNRFLSDDLIKVCVRRLAFGRSRDELHQKGRIARAIPTLRALGRGDYHRYAHGARSLLKDLIV